MKFTSKIEKAINKASLLHKEQTRRADNLTPYIVHPFAVALILTNYTDNEDIIAAALLHDTIEDTAYTPEEMEKDFGKTVKEIVLGVTEPKISGGLKQSWMERKLGYLEKLKSASMESLMVSAADKIHNLSSLIQDYKIYGDDLLKKFHTPIENRLEFDRKVLEILRGKLNSPIVEELSDAIKKAELVFRRS